MKEGFPRRYHHSLQYCRIYHWKSLVGSSTFLFSLIFLSYPLFGSTLLLCPNYIKKCQTMESKNKLTSTTTKLCSHLESNDLLFGGSDPQNFVVPGYVCISFMKVELNKEKGQLNLENSESTASLDSSFLLNTGQNNRKRRLPQMETDIQDKLFRREATEIAKNVDTSFESTNKEKTFIENNIYCGDMKKDINKCKKETMGKDDKQTHDKGIRLDDFLMSVYPEVCPSTTSIKKSVRRELIYVNKEKVKERGHIVQHGDFVHFMARNDGAALSRLSGPSAFKTKDANVSEKEFTEIEKPNELLNLERKRTELRKIIDIYYEDDQLAVIYKPPNLPVYSPKIKESDSDSDSKNSDGDEEDNDIVLNAIEITIMKAGKKGRTSTVSYANLYSILNDLLLPVPMGVFNPLRRPTPCHRLDKATAGLLVVAKTRPSLSFLTGCFKNRNIRKKYYTLSVKCPKYTMRKEMVEHNVNIQKNFSGSLKSENNVSLADKNKEDNNRAIKNRNRMMVIDAKERKRIIIKTPLFGKKAHSEMEVEEEHFLEENRGFISSLLTYGHNHLCKIGIEIFTGRKHQIRRHLFEPMSTTTPAKNNIQVVDGPKEEMPNQLVRYPIIGDRNYNLYAPVRDASKLDTNIEYLNFENDPFENKVSDQTEDQDCINIDDNCINTNDRSQSSVSGREKEHYTRHNFMKTYRKSLLKYQIPLCLLSAYLQFPYPVSDLINSKVSTDLSDEFPHAVFEDKKVTSKTVEESLGKPRHGNITDTLQNNDDHDNSQKVRYLTVQVPHSVIDQYFSDVIKRLQSI